MKACLSCERSLPVSEFYKAKSNRDGRMTRCRECVKAARRASYRRTTPTVEKVAVSCLYCGAIKLRWPSLVRKRNFCSQDHYYKWLSVSQRGKNNPNYGRRWSEKHRRQQSKLVKERMDSPSIRHRIGSANRGKKFSSERIRRMHETRPPESYSHRHSDEAKRKIGRASARKFEDPDYRARHRKTMEQRGHWIPLADKENYAVYFVEADWAQRMWGFVEDHEQQLLLAERGVFNARKNPKGVVRDHMLSRKTGFRLGVFPEILRHPCNLQILTHADNVAKEQSGSICSDSISVEELLSRILSYKGSWFEHYETLALVERYKEGKRWSSKHEGGS